MSFCKNCGTRLEDEDVFCKNCGQAKNQVSHPAVQESKQGHGTMFYVGCVIGILVIAGIGYYVTDNWNSSTIKVSVHASLHVTQDVDVYVYIDGDEAWRKMGAQPQSIWYKTDMYTFSMFNSSKTIEVKAIAIGGGLGTMTDSEIIVVTDGSRHDIHLYV